jgi:HSP20 family protein
LFIVTKKQTTMIVSKILPAVQRPAYNSWSTFDKLVADLFRDVNPPSGNAQLPPVNIIETDAAWRIELVVPGLRKEDLTIELKDNQLTISAQKTEEKAEGEKVRLRQFNLLQFTRRFQLPEVVDQEQIEARCEAGILTLQLPKRAEALPQQPRRLEIA